MNVTGSSKFETLHVRNNALGSSVQVKQLLYLVSLLPIKETAIYVVHETTLLEHYTIISYIQIKIYIVCICILSVCLKPISFILYCIFYSTPLDLFLIPYITPLDLYHIPYIAHIHRPYLK